MFNCSIFLLLYYVYIQSTSSNIQVPSLSDLQLLKNEIINAYDTISLGEPTGVFFKPLAGSVLRLIFHDCGGPPEGNTPGIISKCDGCIELDNFSDHANLLQKAIDPLDDIYLNDTNQWNTKMSRSDFWAYAATVAILHTRDRATDSDTMPAIPYFFGRQDCSTSPDLDNTITAPKRFPAAIFGWTESFNWMNTNFGFNEEEIVAILGAHTIGRAHPTDSGFTGPWIGPWGTFDNFYYQSILSGNWAQRTAAGNGLKEWSQGSSFMMLNADISLFKDLDDHDVDGAVNCGLNINNCMDNNATLSIIQSFANDNQLWLNTFVPTYIKMITAGYDINNDFITVSDEEVESNTTAPTPAPTNDPTPSPTDAPFVVGEPTASPTKLTDNPTSPPTDNQSPTNTPTQLPTTSPITTIQPTTNEPTTRSPTSEYETCGIASLVADVSLSIARKISDRTIEITITGPADKWFAFGFGTTDMKDSYAIIVEGNEFNVVERILSESSSASTNLGLIVGSSGIITKRNDGNTRTIILKRPYSFSQTLDFTKFMECTADSIDLISAKGISIFVGYHGYNNKIIGKLNRSCSCNTLNPTPNPTQSDVSPTVIQEKQKEIVLVLGFNLIFLLLVLIIPCLCIICGCFVVIWYKEHNKSEYDVTTSEMAKYDDHKQQETKTKQLQIQIKDNKQNNVNHEMGNATVMNMIDVVKYPTTDPTKYSKRNIIQEEEEMDGIGIETNNAEQNDKYQMKEDTEESGEFYENSNEEDAMGGATTLYNINSTKL